MTGRILIDTNLIVRFLVEDHEKQAKTAARLFDACDRGELTVVVLPPVLAECVFVLESFYERARVEIASALTTLISSPGIEIAEVPIHLDALNRYRKTKVHFVDCVIAATAASQDTSVATFDRGFRKFGDFRVEVLDS